MDLDSDLSDYDYPFRARRRGAAPRRGAAACSWLRDCATAATARLRRRRRAAAPRRGRAARPVSESN